MAPRRSDRWVLVPGTLCTPEVFAPMLEQLGVPPDRCQFIDASAPHVHDYDAPLCAAVRGGDIVCGFSLGAMILAHNLGALTQAKAVILLACNPFPDAAGNRINREATRDRILAGDEAGWVEDHWAAMSTKTSTALKTQVASMATRMADHIAAQTQLAISRPGATEQLMASQLPLVFVTGGQDRLTPPDRLPNIAQACPNASFNVLDGLGHFALLEAPDRVALAISEGLDAVSPPNTSTKVTP